MAQVVIQYLDKNKRIARAFKSTKEAEKWMSKIKGAWQILYYGSQQDWNEHKKYII